MKNPSDLPSQVLAFAHRHGMLPAGSVVLCALSGGADSMALLACLRALAKDRDWTVLAAHYDHQLRGAESRRDADFVADWCARKHIPLTVGRGDVAAEAARTGRGVEETARAMRYAFLEETAATLGAAAIATAHNADDNVETLLLHLLRGTGLDGLAGIPPVRGRIVRPLLAVPRADIKAYLQAEGIPHVEDSSNGDTTYTRNRLRREVLPVLQALNPNLSRRLAENLEHIRADRAFLEHLGAELAQTAREEPEGLSLEIRPLRDAPPPVAVRAVKQVLARLGRHQISAVHLDQILALARGDAPSAWTPLPRGLWVRRVYGRLLFTQTPPETTVPAPLTLHAAGVYFWGPWRLTLEEVTCPAPPEKGPFAFHLRPGFPLTLRGRQTGDTLTLPGRRTKPLKKWYVDEKIPRQDRDTLPVLTCPSGLLAAAGLGPQSTALAAPGSPALRVTFDQTERERT